MNPIRRLRFQSSVTQQKLALRAGTSQPTIALYESGKRSPTLETLERLAKSVGFEISVSFVPPLTRTDLRSLAYHQALMVKLKSNPKDILFKARENLKSMSKKHSGAKRLFDQWRIWLDLPIEELVNCCLDSGLLARDMRQVTPFSGILTAKERLVVLKDFRLGESGKESASD